MTIKLLFASLILLISGSVYAQPVNDDPCNAIPIIVNSTCSFVQYDNVGATDTPGIPVPSCGGFDGEDIWFVAIVPPSGILVIDGDVGTLSNMNVAAYSASTCAGPFTEVGCETGGSTNGNMPLLNLTGLTPGSLIFIRMYDNFEPPIIFIDPGDPLEQGTFSLCVYDVATGGSNSTVYDCSNTPPAGDDCANATPICTFDGYCGSTAGYSDQSWSSLDGAFCGSIENNSFMTFTANSTTVQLTVDVTDPINDCGTGIQFLMFSAPSCGGTVTDLGCQSPMNLGSNTFTGTGLTIGDTYYLMVDGWAGDICDYVIQAISGVEGSLSVGGDQTICLGSSASIVATGQDGNPVTWTGQFLNQTTGDSVVASPTAVGTYMYIGEAPALISNCGGVADTMYVTVVSPTSVSVVQAACDVNGNVVLTATGGGNYVWFPPSLVSSTSGNPITVTPTFSGTYYVYGQSGANCIDSASIIVDPCSSCTPPVITITNPPAICEPGTVDITTAVGNTGGATLSYHPTLADASAGTNPLGSTTVSTVGTTPYFVRAVDPSDPTCFTIETIIVTINPLPTVTAPADFVACPDQDIVLIAGNPDGANVSWDNGVTDGINFMQTTVGTITYTVTADLNGCISTATVDVTVNPAPNLVVNGGNTQVICPGSNITVDVTFTNANGTPSYNWVDDQGNVISTNSSVNVSPGTTQWYYIFASDDCYTLLDSVKIQLDEFSFVNFAITNATGCPPSINDNGEVVITMNPNITFNYTMVNQISGVSATQIGGTTGNEFVDIVGGTPYIITATNPITGCTVDTVITVGVGLNPITFNPPIITDVTCPGALDGSASITNIVGGNGNLPYTIAWTPLSGAPIIGSVPTLPGPYSETSLYGSTWSVTVTDDEGCAFTQVFSIFEPAPINLGLTTSSPLCYGQNNGSVNINATGGTTPFTFWISDTDSTQLNLSNSNAAEFLVEGWYYTSLEDDNGCIESDSIFLAQPDSIYATINAVNPLCAGDNSGWAQATVFDNQGDVSYQWIANPSETVTDSSWVLPQGSYTLTIVDSVGCIWQGAFTLVDPPAITMLTISAEPSYCRASGLFPGSGTVSGTATGGTGTLNYAWVAPDGQTVNQNTWGNRVPGWYTLFVQDLNGCIIFDSVYVDSLNPIADFTVNPLDGTEPVTVTITDQSTDRVTNDWDLGLGGSNSVIIGYDSIQSPFDTVYTAGDYTICLTVTNDFNCIDSLCQTIEIYPAPSIEMPNVITPNGDGNNDLWSPISEGMAELSCTIVNRWGNEIYILDGPSDTWDGTNMKSGKAVASGVYTYVYTAKALNGTDYEGQGFIHVFTK